MHVRFEFDRRFAVLLQGSVFDVAGGPSEDENRGSERGEHRELQHVGASGNGRAVSRRFVRRIDASIGFGERETRSGLGDFAEWEVETWN